MNLIFQSQNARKAFTVQIISYLSNAVLSATLSTPMSVDTTTPTLQHHQKHYNQFFYYSEIVKMKRPLFYFYLYLIFLLCFFKEETWRQSAVICAVSSSARFETTKLNSGYDKFCLDHSLSNFSKALLDNNTFAIETLFFFSKMLSNTDRKRSNLSQQI